MKQGYVQIYTGDGKGKTTAALGLAMRAVGAGLSVCIVQFIKSREYSEILTLHKLGIPVHQFGRGCFIMGEASPEDKAAAAEGLVAVRSLMAAGELDVLILDEINVALSLGLLALADVLDLVRSKPVGLELVLTGRGAPPELIAAADLVTEMVKVKHYYDAGVSGRKGIES
jgi:cob(I)alamin adenosyltransferase